MGLSGNRWVNCKNTGSTDNTALHYKTIEGMVFTLFRAFFVGDRLGISLAKYETPVPLLKKPLY